MKKPTVQLWTRNFTLVTIATALGAAGGIAGGFALSFLVFDETGSTLASALIVAIQLVPNIFIPFLVAPLMDRLPRKAFLVGGDICNGIVYGGMGLWLMRFDFSYVGYLGISVLLACLSSVDRLAYTSIYPQLIPNGAEQKGYAVSSMLYPILTVVMTPLAAVLLDTLGVPLLLVMQGALSLAAALTESFIRLEERRQAQRQRYTIAAWRADIREGFAYLKEERGVRSIYEYMSVTNGVAGGYAPILVAFFRTMPGMTAAMYSLFSVAEFAGRTIGSSRRPPASVRWRWARWERCWTTACASRCAARWPWRRAGCSSGADGRLCAESMRRRTRRDRAADAQNVADLLGNL